MNERTNDLPEGKSDVLLKVQRLGWLCMFLFTMAAFTGFTGSGPLARKTVGGIGIEVNHSMFKRRNASSEMQIQIATRAPGPVRIWVSREYMRQFAVEDIRPEPQSETSTEQILLYTFDTVQYQPLVIAFRMRGLESTIGWVSGSVGVEGAGQVRISEFVWP